MTVVHWDWTAAIITLVLFVGIGCYVVGRLHHRNDARAYAGERRMAQSLLSADHPESSMAVITEHIPAGRVPTVVNVYLVTPAQAPQSQERLLIVEGDISPCSQTREWRTRGE